MAKTNRRRGRKSAHPVARVIKATVHWTVVMMLSLFYYAIIGLSVGLGGAFLWNSLGPGDASGFVHPVAGLIMVPLGVLWFFFFPRFMKRLTGREPMTGTYHGPFF